MVSKVLRVDEGLTALGARETPLPAVRSAHVRLHVEIPGKRLAADRTDDAAGVLAPVVGALPRRFDLLATQPTLVQVAVHVQTVVLVQVGAADEPATAQFALKRSVARMGSTVGSQQAGAAERPPA